MCAMISAMRRAASSAVHLRQRLRLGGHPPPHELEAPDDDRQGVVDLVGGGASCRARTRIRARSADPSARRSRDGVAPVKHNPGITTTTTRPAQGPVG
jgi:hypothetical protein